ncbi:MAG TPA: LytTR family DNA-binding domain-containing protein [Kofleriaceae bacterium]|nr:LytTR family DNA-binding domain-containing protein [Kofleriaceae bacterium]
MTVRVAIADDEPLARRRLRSLLERDLDVAIVAECKNGNDTARAVESIRPDILFLDVLMPGLDGLSIVERIPASERPHVVLVTAHDRYAVRAFDVHAVDYLLKPYDDERFDVALDRAKAAVRQRRGEPARIAVRGPRGTTLVDVDAIDWIESADNYVELHIGSERHLVRTTLTELANRLDPTAFVRVHRTAIVNLRRIREVHAASLVLVGGESVPLSRRYRTAVESRIAP